jgi:septal ring factor EnvC (AmiA/AmiB activator)
MHESFAAMNGPMALHLPLPLHLAQAMERAPSLDPISTNLSSVEKKMEAEQTTNKQQQQQEEERKERKQKRKKKGKKETPYLLHVQPAHGFSSLPV